MKKLNRKDIKIFAMTVLINVVFLVLKQIGYSHEACSFANANTLSLWRIFQIANDLIISLISH